MAWLVSSVALMQILDVVMRVPPLFILDSVFNGTLTVPWVHDERVKFLGIGGTFFSVYGLLAMMTCSMCLILMFMTTKQLLHIYSLLLAGGILLVSTAFNNRLFDTRTSVSTSDTSSTGESLGQNPYEIAVCIVSQLSLAFCYDRLMYGVHGNILPSLRLSTVWRSAPQTYLLFVFPIAFAVAWPRGADHWIGTRFFVLVAGTELALAAFLSYADAGAFLRGSMRTARGMMAAYGPVMFVELQWHRLHVPEVLRVFWLTRAMLHFSYAIVVRAAAANSLSKLNVVNLTANNFTAISSVASDAANLFAADLHAADYDVDFGDFFHADDVAAAITFTLLHGCETSVALLGMTSAVSRAAHYVGEAAFRLVGCARDADREIGTMSAVLFLMLALQTGLTGMDDTKRLIRLYRNTCLLAMAMLHFLHGPIHQHLLALGAAGIGSASAVSHMRAVGASLALVSIGAVGARALWVGNTIGTWLLAVLAFSMELAVKMIITLTIYVMYVINAQREEFWERLDDYVFCVKSTGAVIEFFFGIFLFGNGAWIMAYESGGALRAAMICVHAYFNIWVQGWDGWQVFVKRRTAANKIARLAEATAEQIAAYADVCAICYQELNSARFTACRHMFHDACLRKWLYVQDQCPLCFKDIFSSVAAVNAIAATNAVH